MKHVWYVLIFSLGVGFVHAQNENEHQTIQVLEIPEPGCIIWPALPEIETTINFDADQFYREQIKQPYGIVLRLRCGNSDFDYDEYRKSRGPEPLNQDFPITSTLTGTVFTFDYLRPSAR